MTDKDKALKDLEDSVWLIDLPHHEYSDLTREVIIRELHAEGYVKRYPKRGYHLSDCAQHNEPMLPNGPCDCDNR